MKLNCPRCRRVLPQIGNEILTIGDFLECGLCGHIWKFSRPTAKLVEAPLTVGDGDCVSPHRPSQSIPPLESIDTDNRTEPK